MSSFFLDIPKRFFSLLALLDKTLNSKIAWNTKKSRLVLSNFPLEKRQKTWACKLTETKSYLFVDITFTLIAVFAVCLPFWLPELLGSLSNPVNALRLRATVNIWFLFSAYLDTKSKGTHLVFSPITLFHPNTIINLGLPAVFALELYLNPDKAELLFYGHDGLSSQEADPLLGEEVRSARAVSTVGKVTMGIDSTTKIARIVKIAGMKVKASAAILKINRQLSNLTRNCIEESKAEDAISQGLIMIAIFLLLLIGSNLENPTTVQEANQYAIFFFWFMVGLMTTSYLMKTTIKRAIFVPIDRVIETIIEKIESSPRLRFLLEVFNREENRHSVIEAIGWQAVHFADAIRMAPDLFEQQLRGNLKLGRFEQTMVTTDLIGCTRWMSGLPPEDAMAILNRDYYPLLIDTIKYGDDPVERFVKEIEPEASINFIKFVGDAALLSKEKGYEEDIVKNTLISLWKTRRILQGTRFCIHTEEINQVILEGGMDIKQADIMGPGVNTLFRVIDLNKKYSTIILISGETFQHLSSELQEQLYFIDSVTPEGGRQRINLYTSFYLPVTTKRGIRAAKIPLKHRERVKKVSEEFKEHYLSGDFPKATELLLSIKKDKQLGILMPWLDYVLTYLKRHSTPHEEWQRLGRAMSNKAGD